MTCHCGDSDCGKCNPKDMAPTSKLVAAKLMKPGDAKWVGPPRIQTLQELEAACRVVAERTVLEKQHDDVLAMANDWGDRHKKPELSIAEGTKYIELPRDVLEVIVNYLTEEIAKRTDMLRDLYGLEDK